MPQPRCAASLKSPKYKYFLTAAQLNLLADKLHAQLKQCCLCPHNCKVNRLKGEFGFCKSGALAKVYSYIPHTGEEPPISGEHGSGTIFFANCSLRCVYCQNYKFSQLGQGREVEAEALAEVMIKLEKAGCHNLNLVTPSHYLPQIIRALVFAVKAGLNIPIVYNTSGYENINTLNYLENVVDIYLTDMRYGSNTEAKVYSQAAGYVEINQMAVRMMYRQVGNLMLDEQGLARRGLIIRHLVLPQNIAKSEKILGFIARHISKDTFISLMSQYTPAHKALEHASLSRRISSDEYDAVIGLIHKLELNNGWIQVINNNEAYFPDTGMNLKPKNI